MDTLKNHLEALMDLKRVASFKFRSVDGGVTFTQGHIVKMDSPSGRHMIQTDTGLTIGLDQILVVNDRSFENIC